MISNNLISRFCDVYNKITHFPEKTNNFFKLIFQFFLREKILNFKTRTLSLIQRIDLPKFNFITSLWDQKAPFLHPVPLDFGFSENNIRDIETIYQQAVANPSLQIERVRKSTKIKVTHNGQIKNYEFPHKVDFLFKEGKISKIYIRNKGISLGQGGHATVYRTTELMSGKDYAHKHLSGGKWEEEFLEKASKLSNKQGLFLPETLILTGNKHKMISEKAICLINHLEIFESSHIKNIFEDLLIGLNTLHHMTLDDQIITIPETDDSVKIKFESPKISHQDIKPSNILLQENRERGFKAGIMDFDTINPLSYTESGNLSFVIGTPFLRSPGKFSECDILHESHKAIVRAYEQSKANGDTLAQQNQNLKPLVDAYKNTVTQYYNEYLPKEDIWALAITFLLILSNIKNDGNTNEVPNLKFLKRVYEDWRAENARLPRGSPRKVFDDAIRTVTQSEIDESIDEFFRSSINPRLRLIPHVQIKNLIKGMLKVDYNERFNAKQALEEFKKISF